MKSGFRTNLNASLKENSDDIWIIKSPLEYWSERIDRLIIVPSLFEYDPQGNTFPQETTFDTSLDEPKEEESYSEQMLFYTDFASVPRVPIVYGMWGNRAHREAVLHDYLYRKNSIPVLPRSIVDYICFIEAMKSTGKPKKIYIPMYLGVRIGGFAHYHKRYVEDIL